MLLHSRTRDSSQTPLVRRFSHSLSNAAFALGFMRTSSFGTRRATAPNSSKATLNSSSLILFLMSSLNSGRCNSAFAGVAFFGMAGTQNFGRSSGMTSHTFAVCSPEGLRFTRSLFAVVAGLGFLAEPFVADPDAELPPPVGLLCSSDASNALSFGLSIFQKSEGMCSGRFDPLYVFTSLVPSQWYPSGMIFPVGVYLTSGKIGSSSMGDLSTSSSASTTSSTDLSTSTDSSGACEASDWKGIGLGSWMTFSSRRSGLGSLASWSARSGKTKLSPVSSILRARCTVILPFSA